MEIDYVLVEVMEIDQTIFTVREVPSWVRPIMDFMVNGQVPADEAEVRRIQRRSKAYTIINNEVYKRSATGVLQRCVKSAEGQEMLREIHQGECGHHASSRALVSKVFSHGFYWPTTLQEVEDLVQKCNGNCKK
jgi:transcription antitermination factor NusG